MFDNLFKLHGSFKMFKSLLLKEDSDGASRTSTGKRVPGKWSTVRKGYKTSTIVRQEWTEGILLSSGAMAVSWPLEFRT